MEAWEKRGAQFLVYGSLAGAPHALLSRLGLAIAEPLAGDFEVALGDAASGRVCGDTFASGALASHMHVAPALDGGGLCEIEEKTGSEAASAPRLRVLASALSPVGARRVLASCCGRFAFVRSITPCDRVEKPHPSQFDYAPPTQVFPAERLMRHVLGSAFGWSFLADAPSPSTLLPRPNLSRHDNAFLFHVFTPDTTASMRVRTPFGAPLLTERETLLRGGEAIWHPDKSWRRECRLFVEGQTDGAIQVKTSIASHVGFEGRLRVLGLAGATLRFFPPVSCTPEETSGKSTVELAPSYNDWDFLQEPTAPEWEDTPQGPCAVWRNVSGNVFIAW